MKDLLRSAPRSCIVQWVKVSCGFDAPPFYTAYNHRLIATKYACTPAVRVEILIMSLLERRNQLSSMSWSLSFSNTFPGYSNDGGRTRASSTLQSANSERADAGGRNL